MGRDDRESRRRSWPALAVGAAAALALLYAVFGDVGIVATWNMRRTEKALMEENAKLREENGRLRDEVARLRSNPAYIEEIARRELGLIGEKEDVIVLDRKKDAAPPGAAAREGKGR